MVVHAIGPFLVAATPADAAREGPWTDSDIAVKDWIFGGVCLKEGDESPRRVLLGMVATGSVGARCRDHGASFIASHGRERTEMCDWRMEGECNEPI